MERGDTGLGRDAYGPPRRERDRRGYGPGPYPPDEGQLVEEDDAAGSGRRAEGEADDYGQLLRRPGETPPRQPRMRQPGRPQPGRFPPGAPPNDSPGWPGGGLPGSGLPGGGGPHGPMPHGGPPSAGPHAGAQHAGPQHAGPQHAGPQQAGRPYTGAPRGGGPHGAPPHGAPPNGAPPGSWPNAGGPSGGADGEMGPDRYRPPNGRRVPPEADRVYRPPGPGTPGGATGRHHGPEPTIKDHYADSWSRSGTTPPGSPGPGGGGPRGPAPGAPPPYGAPGASGLPGAPGPAGAAAAAGAPPLREHPPAGPHVETPEGRDRPGAPPEPPGPVIRQRDTALPEDQPGGPAQPVASIAPDDLEAFARDLRALRAKADLDYPEMAEISHFEMKTLAAAAAGLRLPTLPVAVAFVRACGGNVAEWEERWQKLAERITATTGKKRGSEEEQQQAPSEPAELPAAAEPPALGPPPAEPEGSGSGEVYVITSAKPRPPAW